MDLLWLLVVLLLLAVGVALVVLRPYDYNPTGPITGYPRTLRLTMGIKF